MAVGPDCIVEGVICGVVVRGVGAEPEVDGLSAVVAGLASAAIRASTC